MKILIGLFACVIIFYLSALKWRRSIKIIFLLLVFEGALRKWVLPQASEMIYFLKDIVLLGAYFNFYCFPTHRERLSLKINIINFLVFCAIGWCLFQVFNPSLGSPLLGIFGVRGYILYIPLIWMLPFLFASESELYNFLRSHLSLSIPVGLIGIAQFFSPASSFINKYSNEEAQAVVTFGATTDVRITGTFSYISGYATYLFIVFSLLIVMFSIKQSGRWRCISVIAIFLVIINSFMTGSRGTILAEVLFLISYLFMIGISQFANTVRFMGRLIVPAIVIALAASIWFRPAINAFWLRATVNKDVSGRIVSSFTEPFDFLQYKQLDGYGTGATHQAAPALRKALDLPAGEAIPIYVEPEMGRIALELGPIGFIFWYGLRVSLMISLIFTFWKLKRQFLRQLALAAFLIQAIQINSFLVFHHTYSVYYWFLSSFIFLLPRLEQLEAWTVEEQFLQEDALSYFPDSPYR